MKWFYDMKIAAKLLMCFCLVALIAGTIGYIGISKINEIANANTELYEKMTVPISLHTLMHSQIPCFCSFQVGRFIRVLVV